MALFIIIILLEVDPSYEGDRGQLSLTPKSSHNPMWTGGACSYVDISSDGQLIVTGSSANYLALYNYSSSNPLYTYSMEYQPIKVSISSDGKYFVGGCGGEAGRIFMFNSSSPIPIWNRSSYRLTSVSISEDGNCVAAGNTGGISVFRRNSSDILFSYTTGHVNEIDMCSDGKYIVVASNNGIYFFNMSSKGSKLGWTYEADFAILSVAISEDGSIIAAGSITHLYAFNITQSTPLWSDDPGGQIRSVDISSDGKYIIAGSQAVGYYNINSRDPVLEFQIGIHVMSVDITPDGKYFVAGTDFGNETVFFFKNSSSTPFWSYFADRPVSSVALSSDGMHIVAGKGSLLYFHRDFSSPEDFNLAIIAGSPDRDGKINLCWNPSRYADNYSVYYINEPVHYKYMVTTLIENGLDRLNYSLTNLVDGYYTFKVVAYNRFGNCSSNFKIIQVKLLYRFPYLEVLWCSILLLPLFLILWFILDKSKKR